MSHRPEQVNELQVNSDGFEILVRLAGQLVKMADTLADFYKNRTPEIAVAWAETAVEVSRATYAVACEEVLKTVNPDRTLGLLDEAIETLHELLACDLQTPGGLVEFGVLRSKATTLSLRLMFAAAVLADGAA